MISNTFIFLTLKNRPIRWRTLYKSKDKREVIILTNIVQLVLNKYIIRRFCYMKDV